MTWPRYMVRHFNAVDPDASEESAWYGLYNTLVHYLLPQDECYVVAPRIEGPVYPGSIETSTILIVWQLEAAQQEKSHPVLLIQMKPGVHLDQPKMRAAADDQIRRGLKSLVDDLIVPKLYGISAMGTRFMVYEYDKATAEFLPHVIPGRRGNDVAPAARWEYELLEDNGEAKIREIAEIVKSMCNDV